MNSMVDPGALGPVLHPVLDVFLLGFIGACAVCAAIFFLRFWRDTRDALFLAFAAFFAIQSASDFSTLELQHPNQGTVSLFVLRLLSVLLVLGAILRKNLGAR